MSRLCSLNLATWQIRVRLFTLYMTTSLILLSKLDRYCLIESSYVNFIVQQRILKGRRIL